ncbi:AbrB family transcriptional regulator [Rhizobium sp. 16-449-1b]|uniref:AbrB/MazE/SpoVT family DNA-binding domain-containing protein n=1 Tax=Rhizobium sp. 16-449-1b TaxID=2819989 RepID=UPI001ADAF035|nr:AbrB family transcriptional regulator [Rhizobium sp. 16-449-1b]MBO9193254.1 AbrB family transcriptional regulator [Rhizobium sp. 16-449-1b]
MRIVKFEDGLGVCIPQAIVDALGLKEGDDIVVRVGKDRNLEVATADARSKAFERIKAFKLQLPPDWTFDRDGANSR